MKTFQARDIKREDAVWVWHGLWLPAVVADVLLEPGRKFAIVRFENGGSAPVSFTAVEPRDPYAQGSDRPRNHSRAWRFSNSS
jgi:hypothetical protein